MSDPANTLFIDYAEQDAELTLAVTEGDMLFKFPKAHYRVSVLVCDMLMKVYPDETSCAYLNNMKARIQRGDNALQ